MSDTNDNIEKELPTNTKRGTCRKLKTGDYQINDWKQGYKEELKNKKGSSPNP